MNKCYFCGKECGETVLTVNDKTLFQSELFRAYMCAECSEAVHSALILLRTITKGTVKHGQWLKRMSTPDSLKCSVCGNNHKCLTTECPNCGAIMDLKDGDTE